MKKTLILLSVLISISTFAFSDNINLIAGAGSGLQLHNLTIKDDTSVFTMYLKAVSINSFFDFTYGCLDVYYVRSFDGQDMSLTVNGVKDVDYSNTLTTQYKNFISSYVGFTLVGKYPFVLNRISTISPMAGFDYYLNLTQTNGTVDERASMSDQVKKEQNDISLVAGIGTDIHISSHFIVRIPLLFGYNLTPGDSGMASDLPGFTFSGFHISAGLEAGYRL